MATLVIPPPSKCGIPPKIGGIWRSCQSGKSCDKWGCGGRSRQFPANSLINGYIIETFYQYRGGELLSTLLQCQSLPTSSPKSCESEYSAYIVNAPLHKLRRGGEFGLSRRRLILQTTSLQRVVNNQEQRSTTAAHVEQ